MNQKEIAELFGVNVRTIKRWIASGKFDVRCRTTESGKREYRGYRESLVRKWAEQNGIAIKEADVKTIKLAGKCIVDDDRVYVIEELLPDGYATVRFVDNFR